MFEWVSLTCCLFIWITPTRSIPGDVVVKTLAGRHGNDLDFSVHQRIVRDGSIRSRIFAIEKKIVEPWKPRRYWKLPTATDPLHRRVVLVYNRHHRDHADASYELMLIRDREKARKEREERLRKRAEKEEEEAASRRASAGSMSQMNDSMFDDDTAMIAEYNPESSASDMAAAMRAAREGIVPIAQAEANLEGEEEDEEDYIDEEEEEEEEEEGYGRRDEMDYSADVGEYNVQGHGKGNTKERRIEDARREWANVDNVGDDTANKENDIEEQQEDDWAREFIWSTDERIVSRFEAVSIVTLRTITDGDILLTSHGIYFRPSGKELDVMTKESVGKESAHDDQEDEENEGVLGSNKRWRLSRLREVHGRRYMLRPSAIELFFVDMSNPLFINFQGVNVRDAFYLRIRSSRCIAPLMRSPKSLAPRTVFHRSNLTELWRQRRISNFDYIMQLNIMAGRSFNDIGQVRHARLCVEHLLCLKNVGACAPSRVLTEISLHLPFALHTVPRLSLDPC